MACRSVLLCYIIVGRISWALVVSPMFSDEDAEVQRAKLKHNVQSLGVAADDSRPRRKPRNDVQVVNQQRHNTLHQSSRRAVAALEQGQGNNTVPFFLHIPKTAGSTIESVGKKRNILWGRQQLAKFGMLHMKDGTYCAGHHVPPKLLPKRGQDLYKQRRVFCVVRHPYERALSEYKYLLAEPWGDVNPNKMGQRRCSAEGLNRFLQSVVVKVLMGSKFVNDCHMLPQVAYLADEHNPGCHDVLRFEALPDAFNSYMAKKNLDFHLGVPENESRNRCPELSINSLDNFTTGLLDKVYAADFDRFGYQRGRPAAS